MKKFELTGEVLTEHQEQSMLFDKIFDHIHIYPCMSLIYAVPNGGYRDPASARHFAKEGVRAGVPDICFPYQSNGKCGIYIELKRTRGGHLAGHQKSWGEALVASGYDHHVCRGRDEAWHYLSTHAKDGAWSAMPMKMQLEMALTLLPVWATKARADLTLAIKGTR